MTNSGRHLIDRVEARSVVCDEVSEFDMMSRHGTLVWKAARFVGQPHFNPVYRFEDYYSYSLLALILKKRRFLLDARVPPIVDGRDFIWLPAALCIDREVSRLGGPHACGYSITDPADFASRIRNALIEDTSRVERLNPGLSNVVLCGGGDSLNLLLLPWQHETIALSAEPNYEHVARFVAENDLDIRVKKLEDELDPDELDDEILECCCRADLTHWRWGASLRRLSKDMGGKLVFWKGQHGDLYTSTTWKAYTSTSSRSLRLLRRLYRRSSVLLPTGVSRAIGRAVQPSAIRTAWERGASMQGSHVGFLREIADCLTVSAYHGAAMIGVWEQADLAAVAHRDMRPLIGRLLLGRDVRYPKENPSPAPSKIRTGLSRSSRFLDLIRDTGIDIRA